MTHKSHSRSISLKACPLHIHTRWGKSDQTRACCWPCMTMHCTIGIWSSWPVSWPALLVGGFEISKGGTSAKNGLNGSGPSTGWITKTVCWCALLFQCSTFSPLKTWLWSPAIPTHLTWPLVISCSYKGIGSRMSLIFSNNCWPSCTRLQKVC